MRTYIETALNQAAVSQPVFAIWDLVKPKLNASGMAAAVIHNLKLRYVRGNRWLFSISDEHWEIASNINLNRIINIINSSLNLEIPVAAIRIERENKTEVVVCHAE